jgi:alkyldihydroxyacetonephosphate synthase
VRGAAPHQCSCIIRSLTHSSSLICHNLTSAESFETSVPYENVLVLCENVKKRIRASAASHGVQGTPFVSCRVTQLYDVGAAVYFYFAFVWTGLKDPIKTFCEVEHDAREEIMKLGGSLSHHHGTAYRLTLLCPFLTRVLSGPGIGKIRKGFFEQTQTPTSMEILKATKKALDPKNIFAAGNLLDFKY